VRRILALVLIFLFVFQVPVLGQEEDQESTNDANVVGDISEQDIAEQEIDFNFELVAQNNEAELLIDKAFNLLRVVSLETGNYFDTKVVNGQLGSEYVKNIQKSDFVATYYRDLVRATTETWDNYTMSIKLKQVEYVPVENGVKCVFTVGDASRIHLDMFPMYMSKERMEELVLKYLDSDQREQLLGKHGYYTETKDRYIRNWESKTDDGSPTAVPIPVLKKMYNLFYEIGAYSEEELIIDNEMWGFEAENLNITFKITVEYILDGKDLIVRVPVKDIETDPKHPISELILTPYLICGDIHDEGYLFVPDGCGGIINLNNDKYLTEFSAPVYGPDPLYENRFYYEQFIPSTFPVFGIKKNDIAIMGIIEEGAEIATITANVSGRVDEFNKVALKFSLFYSEKIPLTVGFENYIIKHGDRRYDKDIVVRYKLLETDNANYVGMAKEYKKYLYEKGVLKENDIPEEAPLFLEMIATVPREKMFLGIPYTSYISMTSFNEAQNIIDLLKKEGVGNVIVQYTDWANGGAKNSPFNDIKVMRSIGGKKGLKELIRYSQQNDVQLFFEINMLTTYSTKGISRKKDIAKLINNTLAIKPNFDLVTRLTDRVREWLISPSYFPEYAAKIVKWSNNLGISGLALGEAAAILYGDYNEYNQIMRWDALPIFQNAFQVMDEHNSLLFSNPNSYAYKYAEYITDLQVYGSGRRIIDYNVPFVQIVLENNIPYSMPAFNEYSLEGFEKYLLKAMETKSALKWTVTAENEKEMIPAYLSDDFRMKYYYKTQFDDWKEQMIEVYKVYNEFYQKVRDHEIIGHQMLDKELVKVTYSNGIEVYLNYSMEEKSIDNHVIKPLSYIIIE